VNTTTEIKVGDRVYLRAKVAAAAGVRGTRIGGGEAVVTAVGVDAGGTYYHVQRVRTKRVRFARAEDLIVHRSKGVRS
jgi:hypothetical protein